LFQYTVSKILALRFPKTAQRVGNLSIKAESLNHFKVQKKVSFSFPITIKTTFCTSKAHSFTSVIVAQTPLQIAKIVPEKFPYTPLLSS
jgi:hypothetical protein